MGGRKRIPLPRRARQRIEDPAKLERIESLAIPPAWRDVWISPRGRSQAAGDRARRRRPAPVPVPPRVSRRQEQAKYDKLVRFAERLPDLRQAMGEHMDARALRRERVCAVAVRLINIGWFRVGSDRYAKTSRTYGVTTLTKRHVSVRGSGLSFTFRAKHKLLVRTALVDDELATAVRELLEQPGGRRLFRYGVDGESYNLSGQALERRTSASTSARSSRPRTFGPGAGR